MAKTIYFEDVIDMLNKNKERNINIIKKHIITRDGNESLFRVVRMENVNEDRKMLAIEAFLELGVDPKENYSYYNNIISSMIYYKYSKENIIKIINLLINKGYNLNDISYKSPILYSLICNYDNITPIYKALVKNGYDIFLANGNFAKIENYTSDSKEKINDYDLFIETYKEDRKKLFPLKIKEMIDDINNNYPNFEYKDNQDNSLLHLYVLKYYDEEIILEILKYLLEKGLDPNSLNILSHNFIDTSLIERYHSTDFICNLIKLSLKYGIDINHKDKDGNTLIHQMLIRQTQRKIVPIFELLLKNNFDYSSINNDNESILYLLLINPYIEDREEFITKYSNLYNKSAYVKDNELVDLGEAKYSEKFTYHPYLSNYLNCFSIKFGVIIGKDCSLKTATLTNISNYCRGPDRKKVFITSADILTKNSLSIGGIREKLILLFEKCIENEYMLFIDDFDKIYNFNNSIYYKKQLEIILSHYVNNEKLNLVITINKRNSELISNPHLCEKMSFMEIKELYNEKLLLFIDDYINKEEKENNIKIDDNLTELIKQILSIIINNNYIEDKDNISNVKVVTEIINKLFECKKDIDINNLIYSIRINQYIKEEIKNIVIKELNNLNNNYTEENIKKLIKNIDK